MSILTSSIKAGRRKVLPGGGSLPTHSTNRSLSQLRSKSKSNDSTSCLSSSERSTRPALRAAIVDFRQFGCETFHPRSQHGHRGVVPRELTHCGDIVIQQTMYRHEKKLRLE